MRKLLGESKLWQMPAVGIIALSAYGDIDRSILNLFVDGLWFHSNQATGSRHQLPAGHIFTLPISELSYIQPKSIAEHQIDIQEFGRKLNAI